MTKYLNYHDLVGERENFLKTEQTRKKMVVKLYRDAEEVEQGFSVLFLITCTRDLVLGGDKNCGKTQLKIAVTHTH